MVDWAKPVKNLNKNNTNSLHMNFGQTQTNLY